MGNPAIKILDSESDDAVLVADAYLFLFGGRDLSGEYFTTATRSDSEYTRSVGRLAIDVEHGRRFTADYPGEQSALGYVDAATIRDDEFGRLARHLLDRRNRYVREVFEPMIRAGLIGTSSEAQADGVERDKDGRIVAWPLLRQTLTVSPMEPRLMTERQIQIIKSIPIDLLAAVIQDAGQSVTDDAKQEIQLHEENKMSNDDKPATGPATPAVTGDEFDRFADGVRAEIRSVADVQAKMAAIVERLAASPIPAKAGYIGGDDDDATPAAGKSFGDFLHAVRSNNQRRLKAVYGASKDMSGLVGASGGYLVPDEFGLQFLNALLGDEAGNGGNPIVRDCTIQPVSAPTGKFPTLDHFVAPTAGTGQSAFAAGLGKPDLIQEGGAYGETQPTFELLTYNAMKLGDSVDVPVELANDAPVVIETLLRSLFAISVNAKAEHGILRGTGVGDWLGILNGAAAVGVTPTTDNAFKPEDVLGMLAKFRPLPGASRPRWIMHRSIIPDFVNFTGAAANFVEWDRQLPLTMLGIPITYSEHLPQANNAGAVVLADLAAYVIFALRGSNANGALQIAISYSEHAKFENDLVVWKYSVRADGMPYVRSTITLADPQGSYTVSPYVYHND